MVRNQPHTRSDFSAVERHNERKNEVYSNPDVVMERSGLNVHFKRCGETYAKNFDKLVEDGTISLRGLKQDAKVFAEMIFDVNTAYFERMGGYDYAKAFFAEAYNMAVQEAGGEQFILSAVMHADERNKKLSEELGRDVYHYHLHVVYVPVVDKEIRWSKRCKDEALRGQIKEVVKQVSHSKKWASPKVTDKEGKTVLVPSYSLLQDRFYEHMASAGFTGFERGERGSSAQHLSVIEYKTQQELERLSELEKQTVKRENNLKAIKKELTAATPVRASVRDLDTLGKKNIFGKVELPQEDFEMVIGLAREGIVSRHKIATLQEDLHKEQSRYKQLYDRWNELWYETHDYREAMKLAPDLIKAKISEVLQAHKERKRAKQQQRRHGLDR